MPVGPRVPAEHILQNWAGARSICGLTRHSASFGRAHYGEARYQSDKDRSTGAPAGKAIKINISLVCTEACFGPPAPPSISDSERRRVSWSRERGERERRMPHQPTKKTMYNQPTGVLESVWVWGIYRITRNGGRDISGCLFGWCSRTPPLGTFAPRRPLIWRHSQFYTHTPRPHSFLIMKAPAIIIRSIHTTLSTLRERAKPNGGFFCHSGTTLSLFLLSQSERLPSFGTKSACYAAERHSLLKHRRQMNYLDIFVAKSF